MDYAWLEARHLKTQEKVFLIVGGQPSLLGRAGGEEESGKLIVPFDSSLSRSQLLIWADQGRLHIQRCSDSKRAVFLDGRAVNEFELAPGETFSAGHTLFRYIPEGQAPDKATALDPISLSVAQEQDASRCLRALLAISPLLQQFQDPRQLLSELLAVLGEIVPGASGLLLLEASDGEVKRTLAHQGAALFPPSRTLVRQALGTGLSTYYLWEGTQSGSEPSPTLVAGVNWALVNPIPAGDVTYLIYAVGAEQNGSFEGLTPGELDRAAMTLVVEFVTGAIQRWERDRLQVQIDYEKLRRQELESVVELQRALAVSLELEDVTSAFVAGLERSFSPQAQLLLSKDGPSWQVLACHGDVEIPDQLTHPEQIIGPSAQKLQIPLLMGSSQMPVGWAILWRAQNFSAEESTLATALCNELGNALQNARLHQQVRYLASRDGLTGLLNRVHFWSQARQRSRDCDPVCICMLDVDNFKSHNDTYGHEFGDKVLQQFGRLLDRRSHENSGFAARFGGEEFVIFMNCSQPDCLNRVEALLRELAQANFQAGGRLVKVTASAGIAARLPNESLESLVNRADVALYTAKGQGRNRAILWKESDLAEPRKS